MAKKKGYVMGLGKLFGKHSTALSTITVMKRITHKDGTVTFEEIERVDSAEYKRRKKK